MALIISRSELCPKAYRDRPDDILIAWEHGSALGFSWLQSLANIAPINGRPGVYGDAIPALVMATGECTRFHSPMPEDGQPAVCIIGRKGYPDEWKVTFSEKDAKVAGLWGKQGPWTQHPRRMLQMRARAFCVRDSFPDKLMGLGIVEELQDYPSIDAQVVHAETVEVVDPLTRVPEGLRERVEKAFETLNIAGGQKLAKINEFLNGDGVDAEAGATQLLEWCRDEFSRRKTGKPRAKKGEGNEKTAKTDGSGTTVGAPDGSAVPDPPKNAQGSGVAESPTAKAASTESVTPKRSADLF